AVSTRRESADRADVDAHAAFFALEMVFFVGSDERSNAAILDAESPDVHPFAADTHAAIAEDAARAVKEDDRGPLLFVFVILGVDEFRFGGAVRERHVLQFALAPGVAHRAV